MYKDQIKEYVSKVAWLEEHFTIRQENVNQKRKKYLITNNIINFN